MILNKHKSFLVLIVVGLGLILLFGLACHRKDRDNPLDPGAENYAGQTYETNIIEIVNENFNSYSNNNPPPSPWLYSSVTMEAWITPAVGYLNTKTLKFFTGTTAGHFATSYRTDISFNGKYSVEFLIKLLSPITCTNVSSFRLTDANGINLYLEVGVDDNNKIFWNNGTTGGTGVPFPMDVWKMIKIEFNTLDKKFIAWYGDPYEVLSVFADNVDLPSIPDSVPRFELKSLVVGNGSFDTIYFDNLKIIKYEEILIK